VSLPQPKSQLDSYWQALSANAQVQTLEGQGTLPKFEAAPAITAVLRPKRGNDYNL
jgi:hypothetical protein